MMKELRESVCIISLLVYTKLPFKPVKSEYDVFMMNCAQSWGQVWMKNQWRKFKEWYEKNSEEFNKPDLPQSINSWPKSSWLKISHSLLYRT